MMNHGGMSWGVSHEKYFCNGYEKTIKPHTGFYNANQISSESRARSDEGIGGKW